MRGPSAFKRGRRANRVCLPASHAKSGIPAGTARAHRPLAGARRSLVLCLIAVAAMIALPAGAQAEALSNAGKKFWLGFPSNIQGFVAATQTLYITGNTATAGTVAIPGEGFTQSFSVTPGTVSSVVLPAARIWAGTSLTASKKRAST